MQARRPTYYMSTAAAEILERHRPGYIAALLERADLRLLDRPPISTAAPDAARCERCGSLKEVKR